MTIVLDTGHHLQLFQKQRFGNVSPPTQVGLMQGPLLSHA
jgi:hypothetical protein